MADADDAFESGRMAEWLVAFTDEGEGSELSEEARDELRRCVRLLARAALRASPSAPDALDVEASSKASVREGSWVFHVRRLEAEIERLRASATSDANQPYADVGEALLRVAARWEKEAGDGAPYAESFARELRHEIHAARAGLFAAPVARDETAREAFGLANTLHAIALNVDVAHCHEETFRRAAEMLERIGAPAKVAQPDIDAAIAAAMAEIDQERMMDNDDQFCARFVSMNHVRTILHKHFARAPEGYVGGQTDGGGDE